MAQYATDNLPLIIPGEITTMVKHIIDIGVVLEDPRLPECSIYKAPENLRKAKGEAYTPQCISIGPIHLGKQELNPMQEHKLRYFHFFWRRVSNEQAMNNYKHYLETKEEEIRQCYAEKFTDMSKEKFVDMMLLDAVFIMELFLRNSELDDGHGDLILIHFWLSRNINRDLILLENQIPFFVLEKLYDDVVVPCNHKIEEQQTTAGFVGLAINYFAFYDTHMLYSTVKSKNHFLSGSHRSSSKSKRQYRFPDPSNRASSPKHFTDLIRFAYISIQIEAKSKHVHHVLRTATKLRNSGVSFEKGDVKRSLVAITFEKTPILSLFLCFGFLKPFKARLCIPELKVNHTTECLFLNLIDSLIHTQLDVELLVEKEVIVHELGSDKEVATLVNGLCKHVVTNSTCYYEIINDLNKHYMNSWNRTMAALKLVYFRDLWRASSTVVGIFVLLFAVFQFLAAVRSVRDAFKI